jgi:MFS transporter, DHA3 family, macrolide efflux protein
MNLRRFLLLWSGQFLSGLGSGITAFALGIYAFQMTRTVTSFSLVVLSLYLPSMVLKPLSGVLADRWNRRSLMAAGDLGAGLCILVLLLFLAGSGGGGAPGGADGVGSAGAGSTALVPVYLLAALASAFSSLREPAYKASITDLLTEAEFSRAAGFVQLAGAAQHLISPLAAGLLMATTSLTTVLSLDIATFGLAVVATCLVSATESVQSPQPRGVAVGRGLARAAATIRSHRRVRSVVFVLTAVTVFIGFMQTLLHPMLLLITSPETLGVIQSLAALGMVASSILLGSLKTTARHEQMLIGGLIAGGIGMALTGLTGSLAGTTVSLFLFFVALPFINTAADVLIRTGIPNEQQGRAWGLIGLITQAGYLVAYGTAGLLADHVFEPLFLTGGALCGTVGHLIGTGPGRGIGFLLGLSGLALAALALSLVASRLDGNGPNGPNATSPSFLAQETRS